MNEFEHLFPNGLDKSLLVTKPWFFDGLSEKIREEILSHEGTYTQATYRTLINHIDNKLDILESSTDVKNRFIRFTEQLRTTSTHGKIGIISHVTFTIIGTLDYPMPAYDPETTLFVLDDRKSVWLKNLEFFPFD